jgi:hypothetical protein
MGMELSDNGICAEATTSFYPISTTIGGTITFSNGGLRDSRFGVDWY